MTSIAMSRLLVTAGFTAVAFLRFSFGSASTPHLRHPTDDVDDITHVAAASSAKLSNFVYTDEANADKIIDLPGLAYDPGFNQFSGYLTVNEDHGRKIHYWYVESQGDPSKDPVVFWTNGGPGCSGLLGLGTEHGPFFIDRKGNLHPNAYAWNQVASILYVEQPAGVGFSYSDTESDYTTGDKQAADDNYVLIQQFLKRFPERQSNDFYVSSESYGGHYIPQLTKEILDRNQDGSINFKGFLVGNPFVDYWSNMVTMYAAFYSHGLLAKPLYQKWVENCSDKDNYDEENCETYERAMREGMGHGINPYALDYPVCVEPDQHTTSSEMMVVETSLSAAAAASLMFPLHSHSSQSERLLTHAHKHKHLPKNNPPFLPKEDQYRPCNEQHLKSYLNRDDVKAALHVEGSIRWDECSDKIDYNMDDFATPQMDLYQELIDMGVDNEHSLNMLVFSGDDDSICSTAGTQYWIYDLGVDPKKDELWRPWSTCDTGQTSGFVTAFDLGYNAGGARFTFATVHGAGHEVPAYRPLEALEMFKNYLNGKWGCE